MKTLTPTLLDEAVERLVAEFHPEQIILFGSHAWGTPTHDSDVDLFVVLSDTRVTVRTILASLAEGAAVEEILRDFPTLKESDVRAVIAFAATSAEEDLPIPAVPQVA